MLIIKSVIIFIVYMMTYYVYGLLYNKLTRRSNMDFTITMIAGMFLYAMVFMIYAIPLKYRQNSLSDTSAGWMCIWLISVMVICIVCRRDLLKPVKSLFGYIASHRLNSLLFAAVTLAQIIFVEIFGRWSGSNNPSEYVAYVTTAIFTDKVGTTDPRTGLLLESFESRTFTQTFLDHSAVVSKIFNLHPLMEIRTVNPAVFLIMANLAVFLLAGTLVKNNDAKQWLFYCVYMMVICITASSVLLEGFYMFFRIYEGKAVYAAIVIPVIFYVIWKLYENPHDNQMLCLGILCVAASFHFTGIALFAAPVSALGLFPGIFDKENGKRMIWDIFALCMPCIIYAVYYMGTESGYITLGI